MALMDTIRMRAMSWLLGGSYDAKYNEQRNKLEELYLYYQGQHKKQIKVKPLQADDNIAVNFASLVVERSVSMMIGRGLEFSYPEQSTEDYIDAVWDANKKFIFLTKLFQNGSIYGTVYVKIIPKAKEYNNQIYPRLVCLNPEYMEIIHNPEDYEDVEAYVMTYRLSDNEATIETTEKQYVADDMATSWVVKKYKTAGGRQELISEVIWPYPFAPIVHWQNLPEIGNCYGQSDIADIIPLQDRYNFVASNISKIIRYHAHPKTWGRGSQSKDKLSWGADELVWLNGENSMVQNLEMQSDLASSQQFAMTLRQALFDVSRTVDISSMADKLGSLTNFALRVLYQDALAKNDTKQLLYGEGLLEVNRRMLEINRMSYTDGEVSWTNGLPVDDKEQIETLQTELGLGILSKESASSQRGYNYQNELEKINAEQASGENVGAAILRAFGQGR